MSVTVNGARRWTVLIGGQVFTEWTKVQVSRDLQDLAGKFELEIRDAARSWSSFPFATLASMAPMVDAGLHVEIQLDGNSILEGWVNKITPRAAEGQVSVRIFGSDKTADLRDCAATVNGPFEFYDVTLDQVARAIAKPFGLKIKIEADVGAKFPRFAIDVGETALSAIEKGARQRGLLVTSDGRDGLILTQSGLTRAGDRGLFFPGNVMESSGTFTVDDKWSEIHVKAQCEKASGRRRDKAHLSPKTAPSKPQPQDLATWIAQQAAHEAGGTAVYGAASDAAGTRYRPLVSMGRTQLDAAGAQKQAEWMNRTQRGRSESLEYTVKDYYASDDQLWRPNALVAVQDRFQQVFRDMVVAGAEFNFSEKGGATTRLRLTGPEAYDTAAVGNRRNNKSSTPAAPKAPGQT